MTLRTFRLKLCHLSDMTLYSTYNLSGRLSDILQCGHSARRGLVSRCKVSLYHCHVSIVTGGVWAAVHVQVTLLRDLFSMAKVHSGDSHPEEHRPHQKVKVWNKLKYKAEFPKRTAAQRLTWYSRTSFTLNTLYLNTDLYGLYDVCGKLDPGMCVFDKCTSYNQNCDYLSTYCDHVMTCNDS